MISGRNASTVIYWYNTLQDLLLPAAAPGIPWDGVLRGFLFHLPGECLRNDFAFCLFCYVTFSVSVGSDAAQGLQAGEDDDGATAATVVIESGITVGAAEEAEAEDEKEEYEFIAR